jgi:hypothetical protein
MKNMSPIAPAFPEHSQSVLNKFPMRSLNVPEAFSTCSRCVLNEFPTRSRRVPNAFPTLSHYDQKARPQTLLKVNNVSAGILATFGAGWSCLPPMYLATSGVLFTHPDSCSGWACTFIHTNWQSADICLAHGLDPMLSRHRNLPLGNGLIEISLFGHTN